MAQEKKTEEKAEPRPLSPHHRHYGCCHKATYGGFCVCRFVISCPDHGTKHIGTHD